VTLTAASGFDLGKQGKDLVDTFGIATLLLGFAAAFIAGLVAAPRAVLAAVALSCLAACGGGPVPTASSCARGVGTDRIEVVDRVDVFVHLPACYSMRPSRRYPVVYLLHGATADHTQWVDVGAMSTMDRATRLRRVGAAIVVTPDFAQRPAQAMADLVEASIVPWADATFRTNADRADRVVAGISRGGAGALLVAAARPDLFVAAAGHSAAVQDSSDLPAALAPLSGNLWLDVGRDDGLEASVVGLGHRLRAAGVTVTVHDWPGSHDRPYWRRNMPRYVRFWAGRWR
jgi:enterochelin esterase-like enzyme